MGVDGPYKAAGHPQNTPRSCLLVGASGSQSALYCWIGSCMGFPILHDSATMCLCWSGCHHHCRWIDGQWRIHCRTCSEAFVFRLVARCAADVVRIRVRSGRNLGAFVLVPSVVAVEVVIGTRGYNAGCSTVEAVIFAGLIRIVTGVRVVGGLP